MQRWNFEREEEEEEEQEGFRRKGFGGIKDKNL